MFYFISLKKIFLKLNADNYSDKKKNNNKNNNNNNDDDDDHDDNKNNSKYLIQSYRYR